MFQFISLCFVLIVEGIILKRLVIVLFHYNVSLYVLPSEDKDTYFFIVIVVKYLGLSSYMR